MPVYECDANMGAFRKYTDEEKALCTADGVAAGATVTKADGSTYTCVEQSDANAENAWEIHQVRLTLTGNPHPHSHPHPNPNQMPIKASYADAFYRACANDYFCESGNFFTCHAEYHAHLAELAAKDKGLPAWAIALIVVLSLLGTPVPSSPLAKPRCPAAPPCRAALPRRPADSSPPVRQACSAAPSSWCSSSRRSRESRCSSPWRTTRTSR